MKRRCAGFGVEQSGVNRGFAFLFIPMAALAGILILVGVALAVDDIRKTRASDRPR